jgi:hypothetical protein
MSVRSKSLLATALWLLPSVLANPVPNGQQQCQQTKVAILYVALVLH